LGELVRLGREIKWKLNSSPESQSQADTRLNGIYGTIFYDRLATTSTQLHQRNVAIYADGRVDRSPCGSGTAARIAQLAANNELQEGMTLVHESIIGTRFEGRIADTYEEHSISGVIPEITGNAWLMAESNFVLVPTDPLDSGFSLR
jgi:proline racemase